MEIYLKASCAAWLAVSWMWVLLCHGGGLGVMRSTCCDWLGRESSFYWMNTIDTQHIFSRRYIEIIWWLFELGCKVFASQALSILDGSVFPKSDSDRARKLD